MLSPTFIESVKPVDSDDTYHKFSTLNGGIPLHGNEGIPQTLDYCECAPVRPCGH